MTLESQPTFADSARYWLCQSNFSFSSMTMFHSANLPWRSLAWPFSFVLYFFQNRIIILIEKQRLGWVWKTQEFRASFLTQGISTYLLYLTKSSTRSMPKSIVEGYILSLLKGFWDHTCTMIRRIQTVIKIANFYRSQMMSSPIIQ